MKINDSTDFARCVAERYRNIGSPSGYMSEEVHQGLQNDANDVLLERLEEALASEDWEDAETVALELYEASDINPAEQDYGFYDLLEEIRGEYDDC